MSESLQLSLSGPHRQILVAASVPIRPGSLITLRNLQSKTPCWLNGADGEFVSQLISSVFLLYYLSIPVETFLTYAVLLVSKVN